MQPCQLIRQSRPLLGARYQYAAWLASSRNFGTTPSLSRSASKSKKKASKGSKAFKLVQEGLSQPPPPPVPPGPQVASQLTPPPAPQPKKKKFKGVFDPTEHYYAKKRQKAHSPEFNNIISRLLRNLQSNLEDSSHDLLGWPEFWARVIEALDRDPHTAPEDQQMIEDLRNVFVNSNRDNKLTEALGRYYEDYHYDLKYKGREKWEQQFLDFRYPQEWFPAARAMKRHIHLHVGPTNSGKTYHALKRLESAQSGFYGGPLRLLAHEVYTRLNNKGIICGLLTGDEVRVPNDKPPRIYSNTVEMVPLGQDLDVGVIDEIQMIGDPSRGWAWTKALLGARAKELHLCGEERAVDLIRKMAASMGDEITIHRYQRLNPLKVMKKSLNDDLSKLEKGDCIVAFSRFKIHELKSRLEKETGRRVAIVYGSLPAEIRSQQADLFNDPNNDYDFLVASDAIGMGLNLSCKRIIFDRVTKGLPSQPHYLTVSETKQIGGRAGRYRSASSTTNTSDNIGYVTSLSRDALPYLQMAMGSQPEQIKAAGLLPLDDMIKVYAEKFSLDTPLHFLLNRFRRLALTSRDYFLCDTDSQVTACRMIRNIPNLTIDDRLIFAAAPISNKMEFSARAFASCISLSTDGKLLEIPDLNLEILGEKVSGDKLYLTNLESLHRSLVLYLWLSYRCGGVFIDRSLVTHAKEIAEVKMERALAEFSSNRALRRAATRDRQTSLMTQFKELQAGQQGDIRLDSGKSSTLDDYDEELGELDELADDTAESTSGMATNNDGRLITS